MFRQLMLMLVLGLSACASPDLKPFADGTAALTGAMLASQDVLIEKSLQIQPGLPDPVSIGERIAEMKQNRALLREHLALLEEYSEALMNLSAAGKSAPQSIARVQNAANSILGTFAASKTLLIPDPLKNALTVFVRLRTDAKLLEVVQIADPALDPIVEKVQELSASQLALAGLIVERWENSLPEDMKLASSVHGQLLKKQNNGGADIVYDALGAIRENLENCDFEPGGSNHCDFAKYLADYNKAVSTRRDAEQSAAALERALRPSAQAFKSLGVAMAEWKGTRQRGHAEFMKLANFWRADHRTILEHLKTCTGLKGVFKGRCKAFSAENLQLVAGLFKMAAALPF